MLTALIVLIAADDPPPSPDRTLPSPTPKPTARIRTFSGTLEPTVTRRHSASSLVLSSSLAVFTVSAACGGSVTGALPTLHQPATPPRKLASSPLTLDLRPRRQRLPASESN